MESFWVAFGMIYKGKHGFWRSGRHPEASGRHPGGIWRLPGSIWRLLEASGRTRWLPGGMGAPLGDPAAEVTCPLEGNALIPVGCYNQPGCCYKATRLQGLQGYKATRTIRTIRTTRLQDYKAIRLQGYRM